MICCRGIVQLNSLQVADLYMHKVRQKYPEWRMSVHNQFRAHTEDKMLMGWSALPAPPTGIIVQKGKKLWFRPGPSKVSDGSLIM